MDTLWVQRFLVEAYLSIGKVYVQKFSDQELYFKPVTRLKNGKLSGKLVTVDLDRPRSKPRAKTVSVGTTEYALWKPAEEVSAKVQSALSESLDEASRKIAELPRHWRVKSDSLAYWTPAPGYIYTISGDRGFDLTYGSWDIRLFVPGSRIGSSIQPRTRVTDSAHAAKEAEIHWRDRTKWHAKHARDDKWDRDNKARRAWVAQYLARRSKKEGLDEVAPPGWAGTVKAMKKHMPAKRAFKLAWSGYKKGKTPHYKDDGQSTTSEGDPVKKKQYQGESVSEFVERFAPSARVLVGSSMVGLKSALQKAYPNVEPSMVDAVLNHHVMQAFKELKKMNEEVDRALSFIERR